MPRLPLVLIHGYSDQGSSFAPWKQSLVAAGFPEPLIHIVTYRSLTNEVTIKDVAEGFDRALRIQAGLHQDQSFDVIVHSTGMLVVRAWLVAYPERRSRLKRIIGLAPATFGSPLAHAGRSTLGAIFKGNKSPGPDFLEAGDEILDGLELAGRFTWDLAHQDLLAPAPFYGPNGNTPYVFVFCGDRAYGGIRRLVNAPGTDGTVRWAGCALDTRKIVLDLTRPATNQAFVAPWRNLDFPLHLVPGRNHGTIVSDPEQQLVGLVFAALSVSSKADFDAWSAKAKAVLGPVAADTAPYQQFVVHAVDERGDAIPDYNLQLLTRADSASAWRELPGFDLDVHVYERDPSFRCFHIRLDKLEKSRRSQLALQIVASSGSKLVGYAGHNLLADQTIDQTPSLRSFLVDLTPVAQTHTFSLFHPFTTTLLEIRLNREPLPADQHQPNEVCWFES